MKRSFALLLAICFSGQLSLRGATRLKDLVSVEGVRDNQLMGYGLVVGLNGTGDRRQTVFSAQSLTNLLERMGLTVSPAAIQVKNTAAVMITSTLPPYSQAGSRIDVTISSMGDASSLQGGVLLMTALKGPDGQVYAVAQGPMVLGGALTGSAQNGAVINHPTVATIPNGAIVERGSPSVVLGERIHLQMQRADFTTAARVATALNLRFGQVAHADNAALVTVSLPAEFKDRTTDFLAELEKVTVEPDRGASVVVNERTGTIVMGKDVHVAPVAIMHGNLTVEVQTELEVSQPASMSSGGTTQVVPKTTVTTKQEPAHSLVLQQGATVEELVRALASIGSSPRDIIAILQSLKDAGALEAELRVI